MNIYDAVRDASIVLIILNLIVSVVAAGSSAYTVRQKIFQILIIWIFPVAGFLLVGLFILSERGNVPRTGYPSERTEDHSQMWSGLHAPDQKQ